MRTRFLSKMVNCEVENYLSRNDLIIVPVGVTELHGGLPLDAETAVAEGAASLIADRVDGLILHNLPYFYAGATVIGRGTVQISVRDGIDYLYAIADSLLRQGFRRQIYISLHGPANMTIAPVIRDFFDKRRCSLLYIDALTSFFTNSEFMTAIKSGKDVFSDLIIGAYDILGRLNDVPLTLEVGDWSDLIPNSADPYIRNLKKLAYGSEAIGHYFGEVTDHMPTERIESAEHRQEIADRGKKLLTELIDALNVTQLAADMKKLSAWHEEEIYPRYGKWIGS